MFTSSRDTPILQPKVFLILKLLFATKSRSRPDARPPITLPVLRLLVDALKQTSSSFYHRTVFTPMFLTTFYGFLSLSFLLHKGDVIAAKLTLTNFKYDR